MIEKYVAKDEPKTTIHLTNEEKLKHFYGVAYSYRHKPTEEIDLKPLEYYIEELKIDFNKEVQKEVHDFLISTRIPSILSLLYEKGYLTTENNEVAYDSLKYAKEELSEYLTRRRGVKDNTSESLQQIINIFELEILMDDIIKMHTEEINKHLPKS